MGWGMGGPGGRGHMYTYGWFTLLCGRNKHNFVRQLSSNEIKKKKKGTIYQCLTGVYDVFSGAPSGNWKFYVFILMVSVRRKMFSNPTHPSPNQSLQLWLGPGDTDESPYLISIHPPLRFLLTTSSSSNLRQRKDPDKVKHSRWLSLTQKFPVLRFVTY